MLNLELPFESKRGESMDLAWQGTLFPVASVQRAIPAVPMTELFGEPISCYGRTQAIEDGQLVDLSNSDAFKESGVKWPVAVTRTLFDGHLDPETAGDNKGGETLNGRLWDLFWMYRLAVKKSKPGCSAVFFKILFGRRTVTVKAVAGPGDDGEPCLTMMLPEED